MTLTIEPFKINNLLEVRFERGRSVIYVDSAPFRICKYLFLIDPQSNPSQTTINSIDEAEETLNGNLEGEDITPETVGISEAEMFWGHCSNLQAWWEHDYDTRLLHSNLSFPLLKELTKVGDIRAKRVFKEEVAKRFLDGYLPVILYLIEQEYLDYLELEEREGIVDYLKVLYRNETDSFTQHGKALFLTEFCVYYIEKGEVKRANDYARKLELLDQNEHLAWLWIRIGKHFLKKVELQKALKALDKSLELDDTLRDAWYYRGLCFAYADPSNDSYYNNAVNCASRVVKLGRKRFYIWSLLGFIYKEAKQFDKAARLFYKTISYDQNNYNAWYKLGRCLEELDNYSGARRAYKIVLKNGKVSLKRLLTISQFFADNGDVVLAVKTYRHALQQNKPVDIQRRLLAITSPRLLEAILEQLMLLDTDVRYTAQDLKPLIRLDYYTIKPLTQDDIYEVLKTIVRVQKFAIDIPELDGNVNNEMGTTIFRITESARYLKSAQLRIELLNDNGFKVVRSLVSSNMTLIHKALLYIANNTNESFRYCPLPVRFITEEFKALENTHYKKLDGNLYRLYGDGEYVVDEAIEIASDLLEGETTMEEAIKKLSAVPTFAFFSSLNNECVCCQAFLTEVDLESLNQRFNYSLHQYRPMFFDFYVHCKNCFQELTSYRGLSRKDALALRRLEKRLGKAIPPVFYFGEEYFGYIAENGRIIGLNLYKCGLESVPKEVFSLAKLKFLGLKENRISVLPDEISSLSSLLKLDLSKNDICAVSKKIGRLKKLEKLYLCHNKLSEIPLLLGNLKKLSTLCLESNGLSEFPTTFTNLENLEELNLNSNKFERFPDFLPRNLWMLRLSRNKISELPLWLDPLPSLEILDLSENKLNELPKSLNGLVSLKELFLQQNYFSEVPLALKKLERLRYLDLSANPLKSIPYWSILVNEFVHSPIKRAKTRTKAYWEACEDMLLSYIIDKKYKKASRLLEQVSPYLPLIICEEKDLLQVKINQISLYRQGGDLNKAIRGLESLLVDYPNEHAFFSHLLELYDRNDQIELAKVAYESFKENNRARFRFPLKETYLSVWQKLGLEKPEIFENARLLTSVVSNFKEMLDKNAEFTLLSAFEADLLPYLWKEYCKILKLDDILSLYQADTWQDLESYMILNLAKKQGAWARVFGEKKESFWGSYDDLERIGGYTEVLRKKTTEEEVRRALKAVVQNFL